MNRGDVYEARLWDGWRPAVIVTRDSAIPLLSSVMIVPITSTVRGLPTEVAVGPEHGLRRDCCVSCDNVMTVRKHDIGARRGALGPTELRRLDNALRIALGLD